MCFPEEEIFFSFAVEVDFIEDGGSVGFVHEFEEEGLKEVVFVGPEQKQVIIGFVIVPLTQHKQLVLL